MKRNKAIAFVLSTALFALALTACGSAHNADIRHVEGGVAGPELEMEHIHHIPQPQAVNDIADASGDDQAAGQNPQRMPDDLPNQRPQHRQNNDAGNAQQQPPLAGKAGPCRAVVMNPHQLQKAGKQRRRLPQLQMGHRPCLDPLIRAQQRRPQQAENHIIHRFSFWGAARGASRFRNYDQYTRFPAKTQHRRSYAPPVQNPIQLFSFSESSAVSGASSPNTFRNASRSMVSCSSRYFATASSCVRCASRRS